MLRIFVGNSAYIYMDFLRNLIGIWRRMVIFANVKASFCGKMTNTHYHLYIDECGDQNLNSFSPTFPIFTLCGVLVRDDKASLLGRASEGSEARVLGRPADGT